jgi:RNA polymerase sigma-70 factor (ECF subfamily)
VATRILGPGPDSEEVLQEVFLRTARAAPDWEPRARLSTWLYRVTLNRCFSHRRQASRRPLVLLPAMDDAAGPDEAEGPFERARVGELRAALRGELARLPEDLAAAFTLCVLEELSTAEAAAALERPVGTVKTHVHRARQVLRRRMARHRDGAAERRQG